MTADVAIQNESSITLLRPLTPAATAWIKHNIGPDNGYQPYYPTIVVEWRYVQDILEGMVRDGLRLEMN
jgi:hypothetical protein